MQFQGGNRAIPLQVGDDRGSIEEDDGTRIFLKASRILLGCLGTFWSGAVAQS